ncbi:MAG: helix-turn-helix domain-containing protein [Gaiellaceae bacterium]
MAIRTKPQEQMVKPAEAAALLGVHANTVRNWIKRGEVPYLETPTGQYLLPWSLLTQKLRGTYNISIED